MKILLLSYSDFDYDGRLRELVNVFKNIGELKLFIGVSRTKFEDQATFTNLSYKDFIVKSVEYAKTLDKVDLLVADNRRAIYPALKIKKMHKESKFILDCRELYFANEVQHFVGKVGCYIESLGIKKADIIICANKERAQVMYEHYHLKNVPFVFENLRKLEFSDSYNQAACARKFAPYINDDEIRVLSTSGCIVSRTSDELVKNFDRVKKKCRLILVGENTGKDRKLIDRIVIDKGLKNITILGKVNQDELKYLINNCHIGIVNYNQNDFNNKYCASGKLYEFVYEGIPVVTTTNPPLKNLCDKYNIGISDDSYADGINIVVDNYDFYKNNTVVFGNEHTVNENNNQLEKNICSVI